MAVDLFGDPLPASWAELGAAFVAEVKRRGRADFNRFRAERGFLSVPRWVGGVVRAACLAAGLVPDGTAYATAPRSHGRLCQVWRKPGRERR